MARVRDMARIVHASTRPQDQITDEMRRRVAEATDHRGWPKVDSYHISANAWLVWRSALQHAESSPHGAMTMRQAVAAAPDEVSTDQRIIDRDGDTRGLVAEFAAFQLMVDLWPHLPTKQLSRCVTDEDREAFGARQRLSKYLKDTGNMMCMRRGNRGSTSLWWVRLEWTENRISRINAKDQEGGGPCPLCDTGKAYSSDRSLLRHITTQHGADDARHVLEVARAEQTHQPSAVTTEGLNDDDQYEDVPEPPRVDSPPAPVRVIAGSVLSEDTTELAKRLRDLADYAEQATSTLEADRRRLAVVVTDLRAELAERDRTIASLIEERDKLADKLEKLGNVKALFELMKDEV